MLHRAVPHLHALHDLNEEYRYARRGTPTSRAVESAVAELEGGHNAKVTPSGMAVISTAPPGLPQDR